MKYCLILLLAVAATANEEFITANNLFTPTVYKQILKNEKGNFLVSPFSAETILAFTQSGSKGQTAEQLRTALHLPNDKDKIESGIRSLLSNLRSHDQYTLRTANKMYVKSDFLIKDQFKKAATEIYSADSENIDFLKKVQAAQTMNSWVEKQTENRIQNLIDSGVLDNRTRVVLINALYFKADWASPFHLAYTKKLEFFKTANDVIEVDTMRNKYGQFFLYFECHHLNAKFLELPFEGSDASMTFILPNEKQGLASLENQIDRVFVPHNVTRKRVEVALPKFKIETKIDLKRILKKLGVKTIFKDFKADLSGIAGEKGDLVVSEVIQKTFIDVNEEGVEAAAATFALVTVPLSGYIDRPKEFIADHPFIFYIRVKGAIIFAGRVMEPRN